jgi:hypothetical protein
MFDAVWFSLEKYLAVQKTTAYCGESYCFVKGLPDESHLQNRRCLAAPGALWLLGLVPKRRVGRDGHLAIKLGNSAATCCTTIGDLASQSADGLRGSGSSE